jgi:acetyltransferase-like isoleucine patch superfamily enzyme
MIGRKSFKKVMNNIIKDLIFAMPDIRFFFKLREIVLRMQGGTVGKGTKMFSGVRVNKPKNINIGDNVALNKGVIVDTSGVTKIIIHDDVIIGPYTVIRSDNHVFERTDIPIRMQGHKGKEIVIEEDCWLGAHCVILSGVHIGKGSVIGASSVVNRDIPEYSIAIGSPAKVIRYRKITV